MKVFNISQSLRFKMNATSGGDQLKWYYNKMYIKADTHGYESISEALVSELLEYIDGVDFVDYCLCTINEDSNSYTGCYSYDICRSGNYTLISIYRLLQMYISDLDEVIYGLDGYELYNFICSEVSGITGLDMESYISKIILIDYLTFNSDRHLNNIFVLFSNLRGSYRYAPILDNGAALFSNVEVFPLGRNYNSMKSMVSCKPFFSDFDKQIELVDDVLRIRYDDFKSAINGEYVGFNHEYYKRALNVLDTRLRETYGEIWVKKC